ncbi:MAG: S8 family serine peptidase [Clostridia bacterium]|nr:S8 family serine peptidase [Clostridia bacterium]
MKKRFLIMLIIIISVLVLTLVGCSNTSSPSQEQIPPSPEPTALKYDPDRLNYPLEAHRLQIVFQDGYELTDQSILKTEQIGFLSDPQDCNKPYLIDYIYHFYQSYYEVRFIQQNKQQIITALEEWSKLDVVKELLPIGVQILVDDFAPSDVPPNDYYYYAQWGLSSTNGINVERAWQYTTESSNTIKIGVFENNIDVNHSDLDAYSGNLMANTNLNNAHHGTHVAGIIGAIANNTGGIAGIAQVEIYLLNGIDFENSLTWATNNGIKIINASFHFTYSNGLIAESNPNHITAIQTFEQNGGIIIAAAGNSGVNTDVSPQYPAGYSNSTLFPNIHNVISVGAYDYYNAKCTFSNYGANSVQIYAPGDSIISTFPTSLCTSGVCESEPGYGYHIGDGYHLMSGTSMAAPFVTGVAALLLSQNPTMSVAELKVAILGCANTTTWNINNTNYNIKKLNAATSVGHIANNAHAYSYSHTSSQHTPLVLHAVLHTQKHTI